MNLNFNDLQASELKKVRQYIRDGKYCSHTAGLAKGRLQVNLAIMSEEYALDFMRFCQRNPKPCPLVGVSDTGDPSIFTLGSDIDVRTDVPSYYVYKSGVLTESHDNIMSLWQSDFVAFALGCSFTFEHALQAADIRLWHIENNKTVPMFRSNIKTVAAGPFQGSMVVSMRTVDEDRLEEVVDICKRFPLAHGSPIYWGDPTRIGIRDVNFPDWGDSCPIEEGKIPVFWACGVTPQVAIEQAKLPICITHKPGHMLITDVEDDAEIPIVSSAIH